VTDTLSKQADGRPLIAIEGIKTYPTTGHLDLVTVEVSGGPPDPITLFQALRGWWDRSIAVVPQDFVYPPGQSSKQINQQNSEQMTQSQDHAITAALCQLGVPTCLVTVASVNKGMPAAGRLQVGDVIVSVDGHDIHRASDVPAYITRHRPGQVLHVIVARRGHPLQITVPTVADPNTPGRAVIGIVPDQRHLHRFTIKIGLQDVGGPSAGLMFALGIVDRLSGQNITGGRTIAGTGEIDDLGNVGPIGGIQQKLVAAKRAGATIFLTPTDNCADAVSAKPHGLRLIRVSSLADALTALQEVRAGRGTPPSC
jgi:PDZ domain-containing protein